MLFLYFTIAAVIVIFSAMKVTRYVTAFNEKTNISAGFIGLILFSMITSLPELLTSSYAILLGQPAMSFSNILGSNAFNLLILTVINLVFFRKRIFQNIDKSNRRTLYVIIALNVIVYLGVLNPINFPIPFLNLSLASTLIFIIYGFVLYRSYKSEDQTENEADPSGLEHLSLQQIQARALIAITIMIIFSLIMTRISDGIVQTYPNIGATLVGSLLLAVATSLPEVVTTLSLVKMNHYNIAISGIVGSSLFNFNILFVTDLLAVRQSTFELVANSGDLQILKLLVILGLILSVLVALYFKVANRLKTWSYIAFSVLIIVSYLFLLKTMFLN